MNKILKYSLSIADLRFRIILTLLMLISLNSIFPKIFQVGSLRQYTIPSTVTGLVTDGDTIEIDAGLYKGDVCSCYKNNLHFRGIGGLAHLSANGKSAEQKAIWVIKGKNCIVENIEFSDCRVPDHNGAGIRAEGDNLYVSHCYFHDNEDGLLSGASKASTIIIEFSEFARNGHGDGLSHNIYIGGIRKFVLQFCYIHNAMIGHNVKSRASENVIAYNLIIDSSFGNASYQIDLPNGGLSHIIGNSIMKGKNADNSCLISYGMEGIPAINSANLYVYNNTMINERSIGRVLQFNDIRVSALVMNNFFVNMQYLCDRACDTMANIFIENISDCKFKDYANYDFHLNSDSPGIDFGIDISNKIPDLNFIPLEFEYKHPHDSVKRQLNYYTDIGAFEFESGSGISKIKNNQTLECEIFPNPVTFQSKVLIRTNFTNILIEITGINGKNIFSKNAIIDDFPDIPLKIELQLYDKLNLKKLTKGIYFLRVKAGNMTKTVKFVI
jgi:hypothetical protein